MLRKCLVALMMGVICAENATAEQPAAKGSNPAPTGIVGWFKGKTSSKKTTSTKSATAKTTSKSSKTVVKSKPTMPTGKAVVSRPSVTSSAAASSAAMTTSTDAPARSAAPGQSTAATAKPSAAKASTTTPKLTLSKRSKPTTSESTAAVERAFVRDAERQAVQVRQTAAQPDDAAPAEVAVAPPELPMLPLEGSAMPTVAVISSPASAVPAIPADDFVSQAESALQPVPIQQAPILPNTDSVTGPQYFSATPAGMSNPVPVHPSQNWQQYQGPQPVHMSSQGQYWNASHYAATGPVYQGAAPMSVQNGMYPQNGSGMYPQTGAALYPAPRPGIPQQVGGIAIENQAFHPHEMLHAHRYRAIYPPYYYKVNGGWMVTPFGVWSKEDWKLQGTQVDVKYHSSISPFTLFKPPVIR
jgi:hypothetical protein